MKISKKDIIEEDIYKTYSALHYETTLRFMGRKIKIHIKSDAYDFQSSATLAVYSGDKLSWNMLHKIPYQKMQTAHMLYYKFNENEEPTLLSKYRFQKDIDTLLCIAKALFE